MTRRRCVHCGDPLKPRESPGHSLCGRCYTDRLKAIAEKLDELNNPKERKPQ